MNFPVYTIFAGVNGAGKSTFYRVINRDFGIRVNADEIVKDKFNHDWRSPAAQLEAGKIAVKLIRDCISTGSSFNQETTLTGNSVVRNIEKAKAVGFRISLFYVGLQNVGLSISRVEKRRLAGGHGIPEEDLRRRYEDSFANLKLVLPLCDEVQIFDNSGEGELDILNPMFVFKDGKYRISAYCPAYLMDVLQNFIDTLNLF